MSDISSVKTSISDTFLNLKQINLNKHRENSCLSKQVVKFEKEVEKQKKEILRLNEIIETLVEEIEENQEIIDKNIVIDFKVRNILFDCFLYTTLIIILWKGEIL